MHRVKLPGEVELRHLDAASLVSLFSNDGWENSTASNA